MVEAYLDESERQGGIFCIAGYAFVPQQAREFIKQWSQLFGAAGAHMVDLVAGREQFEGMAQSERDRLLREAIKIINQRITAGVVVSCNLAEVRTFSPSWIRGFGDAYPICCHLSMTLLGKWLRDGGFADRVTYVFEAGHAFESEANDFMRNAILSQELKESYRYSGHAFLPRKDAIPLQSADMLAWEWTKCRDETLEQKVRPLRKSLRAIFENSLERYSVRHITGEPLKKFMNKVRGLGLAQIQEEEDADRSRRRR